jgi:hypothetical protein
MVRILRTWAKDAAAFAEVLADQDAAWGAEHFLLAGGRAVLCGPGMYVNAAVAAGLDGALSKAEWQHFEGRCEAVGVSSAFEVSPATSTEVVHQLAGRGYEVDGLRSALVLPFDSSPPLADPDPAFSIHPANGELLPLWQRTSAQGWGHTTPSAIKASDAFARAATVVDGDRLVVVRSADDGRPVGCASMTVTDGIATLGGMSTLANERGRGVQAALITHRLRVARILGCELAVSTAAPDGASERNLLRHGFERSFSVETHIRHQ